MREGLIRLTNYSHTLSQERIHSINYIHSQFESEIMKHAGLIRNLSRDLVTNQVMFSLAAEADYHRRMTEVVDELRRKISTFELGI